MAMGLEFMGAGWQPMNAEPTQAETIAALSLRCDGPDQAEKFDRAVRGSLSVSKEAVL